MRCSDSSADQKNSLLLDVLVFWIFFFSDFYSFTIIRLSFHSLSELWYLDRLSTECVFSSFFDTFIFLAMGKHNFLSWFFSPTPENPTNKINKKFQRFLSSYSDMSFNAIGCYWFASTVKKLAPDYFAQNTRVFSTLNFRTLESNLVIW